MNLTKNAVGIARSILIALFSLVGVANNAFAADYPATVQWFVVSQYYTDATLAANAQCVSNFGSGAYSGSLTGTVNLSFSCYRPGTGWYSGFVLNGSLSCPSGGTLSGSMCVMPTTTTTTTASTTTTSNANCPQSGSRWLSTGSVKAPDTACLNSCLQVASGIAACSGYTSDGRPYGCGGYYKQNGQACTASPAPTCPAGTENWGSDTAPVCVTPVSNSSTSSSSTTSTSTTTTAPGASSTSSSTTSSSSTSSTTATTSSGSTTTTTGTVSTSTYTTPGGGGTIVGSQCGATDQPPCRIDETGTPTGAGAYDRSNEAVNAGAGRVEEGMRNATSPEGKDTSPGWTPVWLQPAACTPFHLGTFPVIEVEITFDICPILAQCQQILSFAWVIGTILMCMSMVGETMNGVGG